MVLSTGNADWVLDSSDGGQLVTLTSLTVGDRIVPGAYTMPRDAFKALQEIKSNRKLDVKELGAADGEKIVLFEVDEDDKGDTEVMRLEVCDSLEADENGGVTPILVRCDASGYLGNGGIVARLTDKGQYIPIGRIINHRGWVWGTDRGVALTVMKPRESDKGYELFNGATAYYSVSRLKTSLVRFVVNMSMLDMIENEQDIETGVGLGLMLKGPGSEDDDNNQGLSVMLGGGYNLMLDGQDDPGPWYWFAGFGWNFGKESK